MLKKRTHVLGSDVNAIELGVKPDEEGCQDTEKAARQQEAREAGTEETSEQWGRLVGSGDHVDVAKKRH